MATYIAGSNVQAETIQTLHLMNSGYSACQEAAPISTNDSANNQNQQSFMGYTVQPALQAMYMPQQSPSGTFSNRMSPYIWTNSTTTNEIPFVSSNEATPLSHVFASRYASMVTPESQYSHLNIGRQQAVHEGATLASNATHALSLSLSPGHNPVQMSYYDNAQSDALAAIPDLTYVVGNKRGDRLVHMGYASHFKNSSEDEALGATLHNYMSDMGGRHTHAHVQPEVSSVGGFFAQSKYLKAVQQLLNEVMTVEDAITKSNTRTNLARTTSWGMHNPAADVLGPLKGMAAETGPAGREGMVWGLSIAKSASCSDIATSMAVELTPQARQELQLKKAKLMAMLEEVDRKYKLYRSQMQAIAGVFESAAGAGGARCYTALALQTISRHFRCLRDAIAGQVRAAGKGLGEEDQFSQQRALQHLHMMHQHAWRPQRGLPERAVSVLRAWLFEHFLHPYPKDADKVLLAKQTGLTRNQVSNWFINARVRLWKPMVEEMYQEESKDDDMTAMHGSNDSEKEREEMRERVAAQRDSSQRGMDSKLLGNMSLDCSTEEGGENDMRLHQFATAAIAQNALVEASVASDSGFSLHEWQDAKKARNLKENFAGRAEIYPVLHTEEEKQSLIAMRGMGPQSFPPYLATTGVSRGNVSNISLTLGLQHRDPIDAQNQQQHQHLFFHHIQEPGYVQNHSVMPHVSQELPDSLLERVNTAEVATSQNYLSSMTSNNFEILTQIQNQKQPHGHNLHPDFTA
ncbi:hypothetical protein L7F22_061375 [Adiantum nelumboides]|nr:hypothetical protein [Adiantum nelumboides]